MRNETMAYLSAMSEHTLSVTGIVISGFIEMSEFFLDTHHQDCYHLLLTYLC